MDAEFWNAQVFQVTVLLEDMALTWADAQKRQSRSKGTKHYTIEQDQVNGTITLLLWHDGKTHQPPQQSRLEVRLNALQQAHPFVLTIPCGSSIARSEPKHCSTLRELRTQLGVYLSEVLSA